MNLLANILETNASIDPDELHLEFCTRDDTATFYHTAMEILNQAVMMYGILHLFVVERAKC
jgi:hypothetical protein